MARDRSHSLKKSLRESTSLGSQAVPEPDLVSFLSIGLSREPLPHGKAGSTPIRQELLITVARQYVDHLWPEVILSVAFLMKRNRRALSRGDVLGPAGDLLEEATGLGLTALLASAPSFFQQGFGEIATDPPTVIVELIPLTSLEAEEAKRDWWAFCGRIDNQEVDILDLTRGVGLAPDWGSEGPVGVCCGHGMSER